MKIEFTINNYALGQRVLKARIKVYAPPAKEWYKYSSVSLRMWAINNAGK